MDCYYIMRQCCVKCMTSIIHGLTSLGDSKRDFTQKKEIFITYPVEPVLAGM